MQLINWAKPKMIISNEGKYIRDKQDIYVPEHKDEEGNLIPEHFPHYSTTIFVPDDFTIEMMNDLYVEETIEKGE